MKRISTRLGYIALFIVWLAFMCVPAFFCALVLNSGELAWGDEPTDQVRVFLMQERGQEGLGVQWTRPTGDTEQCSRTTVRYWMWAGEAENAAVCQCVGLNTAADAPAGCQLE